MRILVLGSSAVTWPALMDGMAALGHQVIAVDAPALAAVFGPRRQQDILLAYARAYQIQAALVSPWLGLAPDCLHGMRAQGVHLVALQQDADQSDDLYDHPVLVALGSAGDAACDLTVVVPGATGDWGPWCQSVTERLAAEGIPPELTTEPMVPIPSDTRLLALAATALAHIHEQAGRTGQAAAYYHEILRYDPTDYSANSGLARLASTPAIAREHWRVAPDHVGRRHQVDLPPLLHLPGLAKGGTSFLEEAAVRWAESAVATEAYEQLADAIVYLSPSSPETVCQAIEFLMNKGKTELAKCCLDREIATWPTRGEVLRLRGDLAFDAGKYAAAQADYDAAERLGA